MTPEERALLIAVAQGLYTLLGALPARDRQATQAELYAALAGVDDEPVEGR